MPYVFLLPTTKKLLLRKYSALYKSINLYILQANTLAQDALGALGNLGPRLKFC